MQFRKFGWKVCRVVNTTDGARWLSAVQGGSHFVEYAPGQITRPREGCGPLCVFAERKQAEEFVHWNAIVDGSVIVRVAYRPSRRRRIWIHYGPDCVDQTPIHRLPHGTVLAEAVMVLQ